MMNRSLCAFFLLLLVGFCSALQSPTRRILLGARIAERSRRCCLKLACSAEPGGLKDPVIENGWRVDCCPGLPEPCNMTPDAAEEQLGVKVARTNKYFETNVFAQLYGKSKLHVTTFQVVERTWFNTLMQILVCLDKPKFTFGVGWYEEEILTTNPQYAVAGWVNETTCIVWGPQADPGGYGLMAIESIEGDVWTATYRSIARGRLIMTAVTIPI
jgi:hypothetical protein